MDDCVTYSVIKGALAPIFIAEFTLPKEICIKRWPCIQMALHDAPCSFKSIEINKCADVCCSSCTIACTGWDSHCPFSFEVCQSPLRYHLDAASTATADLQDTTWVALAEYSATAPKPSETMKRVCLMGMGVLKSQLTF